VFLLPVLFNTVCTAKDATIISFNVDSTYQTIHNFGASDAWSGQFVGNWPDAKRMPSPIGFLAWILYQTAIQKALV
jgi:hypothetical protein